MADNESPFDQFDVNPFDKFDEEGTTPDEEIPMDPELEAFLKRNPDIKLTGEFADDPRVPIGGGTGEVGYDVTDQVREAAKERGPRDYEYFYGTGPERASLSTRVGAIIGALSDAFPPFSPSPPPSPSFPRPLSLLVSPVYLA